MQFALIAIVAAFVESDIFFPLSIECLADNLTLASLHSHFGINLTICR